MFRIPPAVLLLALASLLSAAHAQLPSVREGIWQGYFAGHEGRSCLFGITAEGTINLQMLSTNKKGHSGSGIGATPLSIVIGIEELGAKPGVRRIRVDSLESKDSPTEKLSKTVILGKVTGDASFELTVERQRDSFTISNRLLDRGTLTKNEIRPVVILHMRNLYQFDEGQPTKAQMKEREEDLLEMKWTDGTRKKFSLMLEKDAKSEELNGPGIALAQISAGGLVRGRQLTMEAPAGISAIQVSNETPQMLSRGLRFTAMPSPRKPAAQPGDTARMIVGVR